MNRLSHRVARLSIGLAVLASGALALAGPAATSPYYGRWTVSEDRPVFTARGRLYKTIDIAPCGNDFCGVSVGDRGACGPRLFRFLSSHADGESTLRGRGLWGAERKTVQINTWADGDAQGGKVIDLYLGDGHDFGERSDNMPKYHAAYRPTGRALCTVR
jgi:hypothetical protein